MTLREGSQNQRARKYGFKPYSADPADPPHPLLTLPRVFLLKFFPPIFYVNMI